MKIYKLSTLAIFTAFLTACNTITVDTQSMIEIPLEFDQAKAAQGSSEIQQWWKNWNDPQLTMLIKQGLENNLDIKLAKARLAEALANSYYTEADKGINIGASGSIGGMITDIDSGVINPKRSESGNAYGGISASWEPDFFGKKRSDADAAQAAALAQQEQVYAAQLLVSSQIAENYFRIYATEQQQVLLQQNILTLQELQRYVQGRFNAGQATGYEVNEITTQITALKAKQSTLKSQADEFQRNIATLLGVVPQGFKIVKNGNPLAKIPASPSGQMPSSVIERRPDLRANMRQVEARVAKLASAKADLYPRFDINFIGQGGYIKLNNDLSHISGLANLVSVGVQLPIFTNGRIQANIDAEDARLKAAVIEYDKNLLNALSEVDTAYQYQFSLAKQNSLLQTSLRQAQKQAKDAQALFKYGEKTLDVAIRARLNALNYQEQLIQSQLSQAVSLLGLYKALGGGWM
ncbi:TolC family protein [Mannheimia sp. AT1]|uniref:TolC family protein n=1 Tax=Mannheimia cairinae TaxID=3025936 RepID=A0ABT5MQB2_9PAST|nr:TolC family protein [Mannheimia cairinae]MDD0823674.1 TolC family protein [Mannheimia cairinae]MDD0825394.1 TolC family protein [Mannheimia cairinae]